MRKRNDSYQFRVTHNGATKSMSWRIPQGMTSKQAEKQAHRELEKFEEYVLNGLHTSKLTFEELGKLYIKECKKNSAMKPKTIGNHEQRLKLINKSIGYIEAKALIPQHINEFIIEMQEPFYTPSGKEKHRSSETIKSYIATISCVLTFGVQCAYIKENVCLGKRIKKPKGTDKKDKGISETTARAYFEAFEDIPLKYKTFYYIAILTGARRSEICGLKWSDFDEEKRTLHFEDSSQLVSGIEGIVIDSSPKTEASIRTVALPPTVYTLLKELKEEQQKERLDLGFLWKHNPNNTSEMYCENHWKCEKESSGFCSKFCKMFKNEDRIFVNDNGCPLIPDSPYKHLIELGEKNNLEPISIHRLRHTTASILIAQGVPITDIARQLGHSSPVVTQTVYSHSLKNQEKARQMANEVEAFLIAK